MTPVQIEIQMIAVLVAVSCAIPGTFLVLRQMTMISDAISHSILPGIFFGFLISGSLTSPLMIILAAFMGFITVLSVEVLQKTNLVKQDAAIGLVFPALFSIGVILISKFAGNIHLDTDAILLGELAFAPFDRLYIAELDMGPVAIYVQLIVLVINLLFFSLLFKELKITTFDAGLAASLGLSPVFIHYALMSLVSINIVTAFESVGAILVVALIVVPASTAYLLTDDLKMMLFISVIAGVISAIGGYWFASFLDASIAGSIAAACGALFIIVYLFAPQRGILSVVKNRKRQKSEFAMMTLAIHLYNHSEVNDEVEERRISHLWKHLAWTKNHADKVLKYSERNALIVIENGIISLTAKGKKFAISAQSLLGTDYERGHSEFRKEFLIFAD